MFVVAVLLLLVIRPIHLIKFHQHGHRLLEGLMLASDVVRPVSGSVGFGLVASQRVENNDIPEHQRKDSIITTRQSYQTRKGIKQVA
jgi:hypothetical protein